MTFAVAEAESSRGSNGDSDLAGIVPPQRIFCQQHWWISELSTSLTLARSIRRALEKGGREAVSRWGFGGVSGDGKVGPSLHQTTEYRAQSKTRKVKERPSQQLKAGAATF
jgi:hypothetical protein